MSIKQNYFLFLLLIIALGISACSKNPVKQHQTTLRLNLTEEPAAMDPRKARDIPAMSLMRMLFDGLTRIGLDEKAHLAIASKVDVSEDMKTYHFQLRESYWSNGEEVLAEDFLYSWEKALSSNFPSSQSFLMYPIKNAKAFKEGKVSFDQVGVSAPDSKNLVVELENPVPYFLELISNPIFFPVYRGIDEKDPNWTHSVDGYVCNGPFLLKDWKHHDGMVLETNAHYWDRNAVRLSGVEFIMVRSDVEYQMFEKQELDWSGSPIGSLPLDAIKDLKKRSTFHSKPYLATYFIRLNTTRAPFNNASFRKAFGHSIQRDKIVQHILDGNQIPATELVPKLFALHDQALFADGNILQSKKYLDQSVIDFEKQQLPSVKLTYFHSNRNHVVVQELQEQWRKTLGVSVELEPLEGKVFFDHMSRGDFDCILGSWFADIVDPANFLEVFESKKSVSNQTGWENLEYQNLLKEARACSDNVKRNSLLKRSEEILIEEMPIIPIYHVKMLFMQNSKLKDVVLSSKGDIDFKWAAFDDKAVAEAK